MYWLKFGTLDPLLFLSFMIFFIKFYNFIKISFCKIKLVILCHGYCHTKRTFIKLKIDWIFIVFTLLFYYCYSLSNMIVNICKTPNTFRKRNTCKFFTRIFAISYSLLYICYMLYPAFMLNQVSLDSLSRWKTNHLKTKLAMKPDGRDWSYLICTSYSSIRSRPSHFRFHMQIGNLIRNPIWNSIGNVG